MKEQKSFVDNSKGCLFLVPTPIGNLEDMTFRAVNTLKEADLVAAEDTRNTKNLLNHFEIPTELISFHEHNTAQRIPELIEKMNSGLKIAQVSDAGAPSISDPGKELVKAAIKEEIPVVPLPGATASITALIASGIEPQPFYFFGFLPRKGKERTEALVDLANRNETTIVYESPYRVKKTIQDLIAKFGPERQITLARELTKIHEAFLRGSLQDVAQYYEENDPKGEYVLIIAGKPADQMETSSDADLVAAVDNLIDHGKKPNKAIKEVAAGNGLKKQTVYNLYHGIGEEE
ncbi:uroporphyrin-III C tetrapyrrole methyltransferase [Companilactobacillus paralimentarius DSM 13238 = JCM 10415]|uniref:Ribosomal RNA small subunit methyltransferase I n=1 Tax=Companilactobacillus paralimentarius DSM 13238 = JCM 10415 TaxID=1122151 RepID=A0A0R1PHJ4_9LACO|nr:16S rRNA (cytidine(1402)-2'-O)-methyltransferase [Companilactobacillus paralimentarius]KAE9563089.1 16S rRNA methyltransferase [Companilactobacillus paralimentarius]KRL31904.1 uroporphyrin-III C tetrapyrrole methyltransferase [Companilactobacillus paralimentarius DSM 13238 = JCM 10415]MDR4933373.1 16S rRNA (cytidine(1402)-2'-O)-methyltransferase [Companilactobacillus paralimentarius]QFR69866.1 16S rRNA (cytidine(1402)-2'-O)-methyltransferase [Companilactobacillus paralimentarius]